ncbi:MAG TPA: type II secretion system secretin GspD [bacterium]
MVNVVFRGFISLIIVLFVGSAGLSQEEAPQKVKTLKLESGTVSMDFNNIELKDLVKTVSELTKKNFILDEKVRGKVTIISPTKVTVDEAYKIFLSVLAANELTILQAGKVYRIIPQRDAKEQNISTIVTSERAPSGDLFITRLIRLRYIDAQDISEVIKNLMSKFGNLQLYQPTNTIIVTDTASNISRLIKIIDELDIDIYKETVEVIKLKNASAVSVASILTNLYQSAGGSLRRIRTPKAAVPAGQAQPAISKIIPDERTNSIIVVANRPELHDLKDLIEKLDIKLPGTGQIHVHYLKNAKAEDIAQTLANLTSGAGGARKAAVPMPPGQPSVQPAVSAVAEFESGIKIAADKNVNALVIISSYQDYLTMKDIIDKLDIPRRQVFVEAAIIEVSLTKLRDLGISLHGGQVMKEGGVGFEGMTLGPVSTFVLDPTAIAALSGLFGGVVGKPVEMKTAAGTTIQVPSFGAFIRALQTTTDINVLSTPHLLTTDNEEAQITVGQNIPLPTGQVTGIGGTVQTSVDRRDVGIALKVTPQINESDYITMKIHTEISDVAQGPQGIDVNVLGVTTSKRSADTTIVVKDKQTAVIGGLIRDDIKEVQSKVPILGDIPVLGMLFRSTSKRNEKTDLIIFLTPYIVRSDKDMEDVKEQKKKEWEKFEEENLGYESNARKWMDNSLKGKKTESPSETVTPQPSEGIKEMLPEKEAQPVEKKKEEPEPENIPQIEKSPQENAVPADKPTETKIEETPEIISPREAEPPLPADKTGEEKVESEQPVESYDIPDVVPEPQP